MARGRAGGWLMNIVYIPHARMAGKTFPYTPDVFQFSSSNEYSFFRSIQISGRDRILKNTNIYSRRGGYSAAVTQKKSDR